MKKMNAYSLLLLVLSMGAWAGPADYVYTPTVEYGEKEIDIKMGSASNADGTHRTDTSVGFGYGVTEYWFTEPYLKRKATSSGDESFAEWENKFQLLETGKYPVDLGIVTEIEAPISQNGAWEGKIGALLQTEIGKVQLNANLLLERKFSTNNGPESATEALYQWQVKYRMQPELEIGAQGFGAMGEWDKWVNSKAEENHTAGPAVFGKIRMENHQAIKYNAAWLIGTGAGAAERTLRMQLEYEF